MFSICIPVYNYDARPLVYELRRQALELKDATVQLLVYDDGSQPRFRELNRELGKLSEVEYVEQGVNIGRARIRNRMAGRAQHDTLIFVDVDSSPNLNYLSNYLQRQETTVVVGGTTYAPLPPADPALRLHWHYGRKREAVPPTSRLRRPYLHFQSNNFRVDRRFFLDHPFPEIYGYGHEDTLWGQLLAPARTAIEYIDNPVVHLGLDPADRFLVKQRRAVENLKSLRHAHPTLSTRLTKFVDRYPRMVQLAELVPERVLLDYVTRTHNLTALDLLKVKWWVSPAVPARDYL